METFRQSGCPLCGYEKFDFFARHNRVPQTLYQCQQCGLFFIYPHSSQMPAITVGDFQFQSSGFWAGPEAQRAYNRWRDAENRQVAELILAQGRIPRFFEIGFGEGPLTRYLLPHVDEYWGIEPVPASCDRTAKALALDRVFCLPAESLESADPFATMAEYFDSIALISVFEHISHPARVLRSCSRLLAKGGCLFISIPDSTHFKWLFRIRLLARMEPWSHFHISFFQESNLEQAFKAAGFIIKAKTNRPLITPLSSEYFGHMTGNKLIALAMRSLNQARLDRLLRIQTLFYVLEKEN